MKNIDELSFENQANYSKLLLYLMNYALKHDIGVTWTHSLPAYAPPVSYEKPGKLIIMNAEWKNILDIPFQLAHEIGHIFLENGTYYHLAFRGKQRGEATANAFAIQLLLRYCQENDIYFDTYYDFAANFRIPRSQYYLFKNIA